MQLSRTIAGQIVAPVLMTERQSCPTSPFINNVATHVSHVCATNQTLTLSATAKPANDDWSAELDPSMLSPEKLMEMDKAYYLYMEQQFPSLTARTARRLVSLLHYSEWTAMSEAARAAAAAIAPRTASETPLDYLRRFKKHFPALTVQDAAAVIGARVRQIQRVSEFMPPSKAVQAVKNAAPRQFAETSIAYARRLKKQFPALTMKDVSAISGVMTEMLRKTPEFRNTLSMRLVDRAHLPKRGSNETGVAYALRIKKKYPDMPIEHVARLARTTVPKLQNFPEFGIPPLNTKHDDLRQFR